MFSLSEKVIVITGGVGFLGTKHVEAVSEYGANPVIVDLYKDKCENFANKISKQYGVDALGLKSDITSEAEVSELTKKIIKKYGKIDILINNAAIDPKVTIDTDGKNFSRLENFNIDDWNKDINVGLTGAFLCSKYIGKEISNNSNGGSIINISSDLGIISPDQRLYAVKNKKDYEQNVKPITYSVVKTGLIGLTRYLATYWANKNVRSNAICPGGVYNNQDNEFVNKLHNLIPLGRMAEPDEYKGIIVFLCSNASSYINGATLVIDGGRSIW